MKFSAKLLLLVSILASCAPVRSDNSGKLTVFQELPDFAYQMVWSPDDSMIALTTNTGLYIYDTKTYKQVAAFKDLSGATVVFGTQYLAAVTHEKLVVWNLKDFSLLFRQKAGGTAAFLNLALSPDEGLVATADQKHIRYWSLPEGELVESMPAAKFSSDMIFPEKDKLLMADTYTGKVEEWDIQTKKQIRSVGFSKPVVNLKLSPDGKLAIVDYGDFGFETWNLETGKLKQEYPDIIGAPGWNNLSGDSKRVVVWGYGIGDDSGLSAWDLSADKKIFELSTPMVNGDGWRFGALNSDGSILAASNNEGLIYFYDLESGATIGKIHLPYKFTV